MKYSYIVVKHNFVDFYMSINLPFRKKSACTLHKYMITIAKKYIHSTNNIKKTQKTHIYTYIYLSI